MATRALQRRSVERVGGIAGLIAPLVGKQPPDFHMLTLGGEAPAFLKAEQPFYSVEKGLASTIGALRSSKMEAQLHAELVGGVQGFVGA